MTTWSTILPNRELEVDKGLLSALAVLAVVTPVYRAILNTTSSFCLHSQQQQLPIFQRLILLVPLPLNPKQPEKKMGLDSL
jgi:hypothetical protein